MNLDRKLLAHLRSTRAYLALTIVLGVIGGGVGMAQANLLSHIVAQTFLRGATLADVWNNLLVLLALIGARAMLAWGSEVSAFHIAARLKQNLRERVFAHLLDLGPTYARGERTGELAHVLSEGIEALEAYVSQYLPQLALAALVPLLILALVFPLDWLSAVVLLATGPLIPLFMILIGQAADALTRKQYHELSELSAHFLDVLQGLATLKIFGRSREEMAMLTRVGERYRDATLRVLRVAFLSAFALEMIATLGTAIVAVQVGVRLLYGQLQFEQAFFVLLVAPDFYLPLRLLGTRFHAGMSGVAAAERIFQILDTPGPQIAHLGTRSLVSIDQRLPCVSFHDVHYTYPGHRTALNGVSFEIEPGQRVALVGATGAGKTTVANLLLGFIAPTRGGIFFDGDPLDATARWQIAWVPQLPYLFNVSIAENICLAHPHSPRADVVHAAQLAQADGFIRALPQGYATHIGERGMRLSGGQAQRIALARAFFADAPFLILDEATSQVDVESESAIQQAVERLLQNRTGLIITHRLATVTRADKIIVLDVGRVAESGTHAELMQAHGAYYRLVTAWQSTQARTSSPVLSAQPSPIGGEQIAITSPTSTPSTRATLARLLTFVATFKWRIALAVLLGSATIASSIGLMATAAYLIASAALRPSIAELAIPIVGVRFFGIARGVLRYLERYVSHDVNLRVLARLRVWFYSVLEPGAPAHLLTRRSGDLLARIVADVETLQNFFVRILAPPLVALIIALGIGVFLSTFSITLALVVLGLMLLVGVGLPIATQPISRAANRHLVETRAELDAHTIDSLQGMADLIAFGQTAPTHERAQTLSHQLIRAQTRLAWLAASQSAFGNLLAHLAVWSVSGVAIPLIAAAQLDGVLLPMIALAVLASFEGVLALPVAFQYLESNLLAARRLFEIADAPPPVSRRDPYTEKPGFPQEPGFSSRRLALCVRDVSFRYAPNEPLVLDRASFDLPYGKMLAITGASGAGKSTLVNLLLRFWDYASGSITVDGRDLRDLSPDAARQYFSVVSQPVHLFNGTIRDNLLLARPHATDTEIIRATELARVHAFIAALPQGYATRIGEQGLQLSGGERQRLAIARALLRDAPILILDEATAHLDALTERAVLHAIRQTARTALIITHRANELDFCRDELLVLQNGRL